MTEQVTKLTITEALAEIKTIKARLDKKRVAIGNHIARDSRVRDPLVGSGGESAFVAQERDAIDNLENRVIGIRTAIQRSNLASGLKVGQRSRSVAEWLAWRREVSAGQVSFLRSLTQGISTVRRQVQEKGGRLLNAAAVSIDKDFDPQAPPDLIVNLDERKLIGEQEELEQILGELDGKLSLFNATTVIDVL